MVFFTGTEPFVFIIFLISSVCFLPSQIGVNGEGLAKTNNQETRRAMGPRSGSELGCKNPEEGRFQGSKRSTTIVGDYD